MENGRRKCIDSISSDFARFSKEYIHQLKSILSTMSKGFNNLEPAKITRDILSP